MSGTTAISTPALAVATPGRAQLAERLTAYAFAAPAVALLALFLIGPACGILLFALTDWKLGANTFEVVGFDNFLELTADRNFRAALFNTFTYVAIVVPGTMVLSIVVAILIESGRRFRAFYRAVYFLPVMASLAAMAIAWEALLHPTIGLVSQVLRDLGLPAPNWLRDPSLVLPTLCVIGIWQHLGFALVLVLAGLKSIPAELYDACEVDGADAWYDRFFTVTLPMLGPTLMFVSIVICLRAFEVFDTVLILTQGGPGSASETLLYTLYMESFQNFRTGYGAALTVVFLAIVVVLTLLQAKVFDKRVHYS